MVPTKVDIGFVVGHLPGNTATSDFGNILAYIQSLARRFDIGPNSIMPGLVTYGENADVSIPLGAIRSRSDISKFLGIKSPEQGSNIKEALTKVSGELFSPSKGARPNAARTVYLFLGYSQIASLDIDNELATLKQNGVKIVAVVYGGEISEDELDQLKDTVDTVYISSIDTPDPDEVLMRELTNNAAPG